MTGRARLRQKVPARPPRAIPDERWDELFAEMGCERDRALLEFSVSSGARAAELLGVCPEDVDWAGRQVYVISKGTRRREPVPASPQAFIHLAHYLDECGPRCPGEPVWRTRRGGTPSALAGRRLRGARPEAGVAIPCAACTTAASMPC